LIWDIGYPIEHTQIEESLELEEIRFNNISISNGSTAGSHIVANVQGVGPGLKKGQLVYLDPENDDKRVYIC
jgi:hypothetical protein